MSCKGQKQPNNAPEKSEKNPPASGKMSPKESISADLEKFYTLDSETKQTLFNQLQGFWVMPVAPDLKEAWEVAGRKVKVFDKQGRQEELDLSISSPCTFELTKKLNNTEVKRRYSFSMSEAATTADLRMGSWVGIKKNGVTVLCNTDRLIVARPENCTEFFHGFSEVKAPSTVECSFKENEITLKNQRITLKGNSAFADSALKAQRKKSFNQAKESL